jgi:hypothetical protein
MIERPYNASGTKTKDARAEGFARTPAQASWFPSPGARFIRPIALLWLKNISVFVVLGSGNQRGMTII